MRQLLGAQQSHGEATFTDYDVRKGPLTSNGPALSGHAVPVGADIRPDAEEFASGQRSASCSVAVAMARLTTEVASSFVANQQAGGLRKRQRDV